MDKQIVVGRDFAKFPGPRYARTGSSSGEEFRESMLIPNLKEAIANNSHLVVYLDDVAGYGSSFLEESFGGLIRAGFSKDEILNHLVIDARTVRLKHHALRAQEYIQDAAELVHSLAH